MRLSLINSKIDPYRPFFLTGLVTSILGVGLWVAFELKLISTYPMESHGILMTSGFLGSYVMGFLMTAVPRMSQTKAATIFEIIVGLAIVWTLLISAYFFKPQVSRRLVVLQILFLCFYVGRRIFARKSNPLPGFIFVGFGLVLTLISTVALLYESNPHYGLAKNFFNQGFVLNLILGLGSRLIPMLSRVEGALDIQSAAKEKISKYVILMIILNLSFLVEYFYSSALGNIMKFFVIAIFSVWKFGVFKPRQRGWLGLGIRLSVYQLALGFLLCGLFPQYYLHFIHISFVGGFGLLTFMISTRVTLAHGGHDTSFELSDKHLAGVLITLTGVGLARAALPLVDLNREAFLCVLFLGWTSACFFWGRGFIKKLIQ